jgi:2-oxoisovalerate dehydrogenase E1 component
VPLVLRFPCGGGLTFGSFHSQELEAAFLHMPGLKALYPSTPQDAFDALLAAWEDPNPVLLFEHKGLYRKARGEVVLHGDHHRVWQPRHVLEGSTATLVTYGEMTLIAEEAARFLADEYGHTLDVWDLRALNPLRLEAIAGSVRRTHRLAVLHEARRTCGFGAELIARITGDLFYELELPPLRIASADIPVPFAPELESAYRPSRDRVVESLLAWLT